jgi:DNA-binding response OmpR family regulator
MRILLVEDDHSIAGPLIDGLGRYGFAVEWAQTGREAEARIDVDMVLLDLGLPDADGIDVCQRIRARSAVPIIMLSARGTEVDRVVGLEVGADDYLPKPFGVRELVARIRAVIRRTRTVAEPVPAPWSAPSAGPVAGSGTVTGSGTVAGSGTVPPGSGNGAIRLGDLLIDRRTRRVHLAGEEILLALKEFDLLVALALDAGSVCTRDALMETVWDEHYHGSTKTLDFHIAALRRKLGDPAWVLTVRGVGFRLVAPAAAVAAAGR